MDKKKQMHAPVYEALEKLKKRRVVPFDVPGHKSWRRKHSVRIMLFSW